MLTKLKEKVQQILEVEARAAQKIGLTPNIISLIGVAFALLAAASYAFWQDRPPYLLLATFLLLLSGFCDALDGIVARLFQKSTIFGGFLDSLLDRYGDGIIYVGIVVGGLCSPLWGMAAVIGSLLVSYSRAKAEAAGIRMESIGLAERAERMLILIFATVVAIFYQPQAVINAAIILLAFLSNLTVLQRSIHMYNESKKI